METADLISFHEAALEADEIRHNLILGALIRTKTSPESGGLLTWSLGGPGECAMKSPRYPIILGVLSNDQCRA